MILELQAGQDGRSGKAEEGEQLGLDEEEEEQEGIKEEQEQEKGQVATDSDSGVVVGEGGFWLEAGVGRSVSGVMARQEVSSKQLSKSRGDLETGGKRFELETGVKRVYINHRSVTRVRDLKYRRITRTKARSMEELREKLREGPLFTKEEGFSHA